MKTKPPKMDSRQFEDLENMLKGMVPHYTPEWAASDEKDPGVALLKIFAHMTENIIYRLNQVPQKNFVAFLDMLGIKLLPAQPAGVPLTFKLAKGTQEDILIPARTQASGKTEKQEELPFETEKDLLATISNLKEIISVDPFKDRIYVHTANVVSKDGDILEEQKAFTTFSGDDKQEHSLYLGHKNLFNIESRGKITIEITLAFGTEAGNPSLNLVWEYWGEDKEKEKDDWIPFQVGEDEIDGFRQSGMISLLKTLDGKIKEEKLDEIFKKTSKMEIKDEAIKEIKTRWVRCKLKDALSIGSFIKLPTIDTIFITASPSKKIKPDAGFFNDVPLDLAQVIIEANVVQCPGASTPTISVTDGVCVDSVEGFRVGDTVKILRNNSEIKESDIENISFESKAIKIKDQTFIFQKDDIIRFSKKASKVYPFGKQPRLYDTFYIGSQEAFSKKDAKILLCLSLTHLNTASNLKPLPDPKLSWEYWNGKGWKAITILRDETNRFLEGDDLKAIEFYCPDDIEETEVNGQKNYWIRTRIVGGDYGREEYTLDATNKLKVERKYKLPIIRNLTIDYYSDIKKELQYCLTYNNLDHQDKTIATKTKGQFFQPFILIEDNHLNLYFGFDRPLISGPIRIFFAAKELTYTEEKKPKMDWSYKGKTNWALLDYLDETDGLIVQGHLEFIGPSDFISHTKFGRSLYWIQASLVKGSYDSSPELQGIHLNTTWAIQAETIKDEILGSSNGEPDQLFSFLKFPVLKGQEIRVRESPSEEEKQILKTSLGEDAIYEVKDEKENVTETWVLWSEVSDFFDSTVKDRHYTLDRAIGQIKFGNGINGMIPLAGDNNIKAFSYQSGGGKKGNIKVKEIKTLKSAVPSVDKVLNPVAADGGADSATLDQMLEIGPAMISHRNRAVTSEDFEWLAKKASRKVVKVRCLPNTNNKKQTEIGWVTIIIVPDSLEDKPYPSIELRKKVREYLEVHSANAIASEKHVYVDGPSYVDIGVSVDVFVTSIDVASEVERKVRKKLKAFFHPLTGGPEEKGWEFGRDVSASDIYALLEDIKGVDHVENLKFTYGECMPSCKPKYAEHPVSTDKEIVEIKRDCLVSTGIHKINLQLAKGGEHHGST